MQGLGFNPRYQERGKGEGLLHGVWRKIHTSLCSSRIVHHIRREKSQTSLEIINFMCGIGLGGIFLLP